MQNCDYAAQRDSLIPRAVAHANRAAGIRPRSRAARASWNRVFHLKMNELARTIPQRSSFIPDRKERMIVAVSDHG